MVSDIVRKWLDRAEYDFQTAVAMLDASRYIYVVFMCQQAIEKCLKAVIAHRGEEVLPIHNLRRLAELGGVDFDESKLLKLDFLSQYYVNARYKEDLADLSRGISRDIAGDFITFTKAIVEWLTDGIK